MNAPILDNNQLELVVTANLQRAIRLRQFILPKAFTGELI